MAVDVPTLVLTGEESRTTGGGDPCVTAHAAGSVAGAPTAATPACPLARHLAG